MSLAYSVKVSLILYTPMEKKRTPHSVQWGCLGAESLRKISSSRRTHIGVGHPVRAQGSGRAQVGARGPIHSF